jgi:KaiC/GvpD/RAD55 family RecA-like ATPase/tetratricopeptide (TPR) repeat protein
MKEKCARTGQDALKTELLVEPAFKGREKEFSQLTHCLNLTIDGKGTTVFISGEAGSGKSRLTKEFLKIAQQKGTAILSGWCLSNAATPYFPFVEAFKTYFSEKTFEEKVGDEAEINAWLTGIKQSEEIGVYRSLGPEAWKDRTFEVVAKELKSISSEKPTILSIEDIHWSDSASLSLLHYISRIIRSERILILATFRSEELTNNIEGYGHALTEELRLMQRENLYKEIKLENFDPVSVKQLVEDMVGGSVSQELTRKLGEESEGNALFIVESLRLLLERGSLHCKNQIWHLEGQTLDIPGKFRDIILRRLNQLKFNQRRILDAASVIGERFDVDLLSAVLGQDNLNVLENLNIIEKTTSLICVDKDYFRFDHAKSRQVIFEEIALPLKKGYHNRIAEKLASKYKDNKLPYGEIAFHYAQAGNEDKAIEFSMRAGQDALDRFSNTEAIKHFTYVIEKTSNSSQYAEVKRAALEGLGDAYFANCMYKKALEVFEHLISLVTGATKVRVFRKTLDVGLWAGFPEYYPRMVELNKEAEPFLAFDHLESARIRFIMAPVLMAGRDRPKRKETFEWALRIFEEKYSLPDIARVLIPLSRGLSLFNTSTPEYFSVVSGLLRSIALYEDIGDMRGLLDALFYTGEVFCWFGIFTDEMQNKLARAVQIGEKIGHYDKTAQALIYLGLLAEREGCLEDAISYTRKALEINEQTDRYSSNIFQGVYLALSRQYAKLGDLKLAEEYYAKTADLVLKSQERFSIRIARDGLDQEWLQLYGTILRTQLVFHALKNCWKDAQECFEKFVRLVEKANLGEEGVRIAKTATNGIEIAFRKDYAWILDRQGKIREADLQKKVIEKIKKTAEEAFGSVYIDGSLLSPRNVEAGEEFEMRLDLVNVSRKPGVLVKVEGLILPEFEVTLPPVKAILENGSADFRRRNIDPFHVETLKLRLKAVEPGTFNFSPRVTYIDELGEEKICTPKPITITVQPAKPKYEILPGRISTGSEDLDALLFGGIPKKYAVALTSSSTDEKEQLVRHFLEAGVQTDETTFYITTETENSQALAEKHPSNLYLFVCNPQADITIKNQPNVYKLKGVENLTDIDIALTKKYRVLNPNDIGIKRICIEITSDVLLQHHAINTRRWLNALLPTLKSKGFTILAVVNPSMHPVEELQAVLSVFDGEICVAEKETPKGAKQVLKIKKLINQRYSDREIELTKESC